MCYDKFERRTIKMGSGLPTIPVSTDHRNGDWIATDIYEGELYMDTDTGQTYTRYGSTIITAGKGAENFANADLTFTDNRNHHINTYNFSLYDSASNDLLRKTPTVTEVLHNLLTSPQRLRVGDSVFELTATATPITIDALSIILPSIPTYANDAAAGAGGLASDAIYKTSTGELRIKL